jgi:hypothetical protein
MPSCHAERSEASLSSRRCFAALSMTKQDGLLSEMYLAQGPHIRSTLPPVPTGRGPLGPVLIVKIPYRRWPRSIDTRSASSAEGPTGGRGILLHPIIVGPD